MFPFSYKPTAALMPGKDETLFEYWASFSPMAPLFGVKWRFSEMMMPGSVTVEPATRKRPASKRVKTHSPVEEATVMVAAAAEAAVEATVEATEAVVETVETAMEATAEALTPTHATGVADDRSSWSLPNTERWRPSRSLAPTLMPPPSGS